MEIFFTIVALVLVGMAVYGFILQSRSGTTPRSSDSGGDGGWFVSDGHGHHDGGGHDCGGHAGGGDCGGGHGGGDGGGDGGGGNGGGH
jgi:hypothetical protein